MKRWSKEETEFLKNNYMTMDYESIGKVIGRSPSMIRAKCFELRLIKKDRWTQQDLDLLKEYYPVMPISDVAEIFGRDEEAIRIKANRIGVKKSPYHCDYNYFKTIDTEEKAYWLGFIYADGYVSINRETNSGVVGIELQRRDKPHLQKFNQSINGNYKISDRERPCELSPYKDKLNPMSSIRIFSLQMFHDLVDHGVYERKTYHLDFPDFLDEPLMKHFIRGFFDGDGCVTANNINNEYELVNSPKCDFCCLDKNFLEGLRLYLEKYEIESYIHWSDACCVLEVNPVRNAMNLLDYIYSDANIYLDRKYARYKRIKTEIESKCLAA